MRAKRRKKRIWVRKHSAKDIGKLVCIINATTSMAMECCHIHKFMPSVEYSYMFLNVECDAHKTRHAWKRWKISEKNIICSSYTIDKLWLLAINRIRSWQSTFHLIHTLLRRSFFFLYATFFISHFFRTLPGFSFTPCLLYLFFLSRQTTNTPYARFYYMPILRFCIAERRTYLTR